jgi:hypothetical protein
MSFVFPSTNPFFVSMTSASARQPQMSPRYNLLSHLLQPNLWRLSVARCLEKVQTRFDGTGTGEKGQQASRGFSRVVFLKAVNFPEFIICRQLARMFQSVSRVFCAHL